MFDLSSKVIPKVVQTACDVSKCQGVKFEVHFQAYVGLNFHQLFATENHIINRNKDVVFKFVGNSKAANAKVVKILQLAVMASGKVLVQKLTC